MAERNLRKRTASPEHDNAKRQELSREYFVVMKLLIKMVSRMIS